MDITFNSSFLFLISAYTDLYVVIFKLLFFWAWQNIGARGDGRGNCPPPPFLQPCHTGGHSINGLS